MSTRVLSKSRELQTIYSLWIKRQRIEEYLSDVDNKIDATAVSYVELS